MPDTIRTQFSRQKRFIVILSWLAIPVIAVGGALIGGGHNWAIAIVITGIAMVGTAMGFMFLGARCPRCRKSIGTSLMYFGGPFKISKKYNFCPCCGVSLDLSLQEASKQPPPTTASSTHPIVEPVTPPSGVADP